MRRQRPKSLQIVAILFLVSASVNVYIAYLWARDWVASQNQFAREQAVVQSSVSGGIPDSGVPVVLPLPTEEAQARSLLSLPFGQSNHDLPTPTDLPTPLPSETPQPALPVAFPGPEQINGVPVDQIIVLTDAAIRHAREIYQSGQGRDNRAEAFSKIGDSTIETPLFLARFDEGPYQLGEYEYLADMIRFYSGSFARDSAAVRIGLHSWTAMDPMWADKSICDAGESPTACELRLHQPSVAIIRLGANDNVGDDYFRDHMEEILQYTIDQGVVPILSTRPDPAGRDTNNQVLRQLAEDYDVPLWDFERVALTLPGAGLEGDAVHLTSFYAHDYTLPDALLRGHGLQNLTALITLDRVWRVLQ